MLRCASHTDPETAEDQTRVRLTADYYNNGWPEMGLPAYTIPAGTEGTLVVKRYRRACLGSGWVANNGRNPGTITCKMDGSVYMVYAGNARYERIDPLAELRAKTGT